MGEVKKFYFKNIDFNDSFFDTFKKERKEFTKWFFSKAVANEEAYVCFDNYKVHAFSYPRIESSADTNITPKLRKKKRVLVKAFKTLDESHHGKALLDSIFLLASQNNIKEVCIMAFEMDTPTINLLKTNGFNVHGVLKNEDNQELVFVKKGNFKV